MSCISLLTLTSVGAATDADRYPDFGSHLPNLSPGAGIAMKR